jgi:periplasmic protein TonB
MPEPPRPRPQPAPRKEEAKSKPPVDPAPVAKSPPAVVPPAPAAARSEAVAAATRPQPAPAPTATPRLSPAPAAAPVTAARFDAAYLNNPPPPYPRVSRRMGEEGRVLLRVFVTSDGRPGRIELSESSGSSRLDRAAETAVASWRFAPARQGERAIDAWVIVPIVFKLEG